MRISMKKIGFVIPWYYKDIRGGAEQELRGLVQHLHAAGVEVEVITTCVKEFASDWTENYFKEGTEKKISKTAGFTIQCMAGDEG